MPDRAALTGILFVLRNRIPWEMLPQELGCGSGMTCWRRLREWQRAGVWPRVRRVLVERLAEAGKIDWARASRREGGSANRARSAEPRSSRPVAGRRDQRRAS